MYITDSCCISPQNTYLENINFEEILHNGTKYVAIEPTYLDLIPTGQLRRIGKAVRMGIGAGLPLLLTNKDVDAMIIGSANGGLEDCINFLKQIVDYNEGTLTPTNFIQSTPNAITGYLAISTKNHCYNNTHVHRGLAFENALLDAFLLIQQNEAKKVLVGGIEEISNFNSKIDEKAGFFKKDSISSADLISSKSAGTVYGEGAAMFIVQASKKDAICQIADVDHICHPSIEDVQSKLKQILQRNNLSYSDIDALILGYNGDVNTKFYYDDFCNSFDHASLFSFKNLVGEYPTASSFGVWIAMNILKNNTFRNTIIRNSHKKINNILLYNHYLGIEHGFILIKRA